jgi:hypothetical protein
MTMLSEKKDVTELVHRSVFEVWRFPDRRWRITARAIVGESDQSVIIDTGSGEQYLAKASLEARGWARFARPPHGENKDCPAGRIYQDELRARRAVAQYVENHLALGISTQDIPIFREVVEYDDRSTRIHYWWDPLHFEIPDSVDPRPYAVVALPDDFNPPDWDPGEVLERMSREAPWLVRLKVHDALGNPED